MYTLHNVAAAHYGWGVESRKCRVNIGAGRGRVSTCGRHMPSSSARFSGPRRCLCFLFLSSLRLVVLLLSGAVIEAVIAAAAVSVAVDSVAVAVVAVVLAAAAAAAAVHTAVVAAVLVASAAIVVTAVIVAVIAAVIGVVVAVAVVAGADVIAVLCRARARVCVGLGECACVNLIVLRQCLGECACVNLIVLRQSPYQINKA